MIPRVLFLKTFNGEIYIQKNKINTHVTTIYVNRVSLVSLKDPMRSFSETTAKLNFMLIILLLFSLLLSQIYSFIFLFFNDNNGITVYGSFCNLFLSLNVTFLRLILLFTCAPWFTHFHCCIVIYRRNMLEFNYLFYLCILGLFPIFFAITNNAATRILNMSPNNMCKSFSRIYYLRVKLLGWRVLKNSPLLSIDKPFSKVVCTLEICTSNYRNRERRSCDFLIFANLLIVLSTFFLLVMRLNIFS